MCRLHGWLTELDEEWLKRTGQFPENNFLSEQRSEVVYCSADQHVVVSNSRLEVHTPGPN